MTVKMSSEESTKNAAAEGKEKGEGDGKAEAAADVKDAKPDKASENNKDSSDEEEGGKERDADKAPEKKRDREDKEKDEKPKSKAEKAEQSKNDSSSSSDKKDSKSKSEAKKKDEDDEDSDEKEDGDDEEEEGEDEEEEEDDVEDEGDKKPRKKGKKGGVPLLDQPLEKSGKRDRKGVDRFNESVQKESSKTEIPEGSGTALGGIPRVDASISRFKNDDMKVLHKILFRTPGKTTMIKKNVKQFCGFEFKKGSEEYGKKLAYIQKCEVKQLKSICEMLDLQKTGNKEEISERILEFLVEPKDSGKAVGGGRPKRTAAVRANNRGYSSHDNYSSDERGGGGARAMRDKGKRASMKEDSSSHSDEDFQPSDGSDEKPRIAKRKRPERKKTASAARKSDDSDNDNEVSDIDSASSDSDFQEESKSKRKSKPKANNKAKGKGGSGGGGGAKRGRKPAATPKKETKKKKKASSDEEEEDNESDHNNKKKGAEKEEKAGATSSSEDDEPLVKKAKTAQPPTDDEIKTYVKEILEGANLEQITMKTVCQQVYAHYPDFDLAHKKDFIKTTVKSLIST